MGELAGREGADGVGVERVGAVAELDPGAQLLAVLLVGDADHLHVLDVGVGVEELLDLARVDVLPAADDHVLDPADDVAVAVLAHLGEVAGVHPAVGVDGLGGLLGVVPVAEHHRVAAGAELAGLPALDGLAGDRVDDLDLDVGVDPPDRRRTTLEVVVGAGLAGHRAGLGHAVGDRRGLHVHVVDAALHHLDRADRAGHDPGAQASTGRGRRTSGGAASR